MDKITGFWTDSEFSNKTLRSKRLKYCFFNKNQTFSTKFDLFNKAEDGERYVWKAWQEKKKLVKV